jgi:hypothetical protein
LETSLNGKQSTLIAGDNININGNKSVQLAVVLLRRI